MEAAQATLAAHGLGSLSAELLLYFAALYTVPGLVMVALTSAARRRMAAAGDKDTSGVQVVRLTNRAIASTAMFTLPAVVVFRNLAVWSPWAGGTWCAPLDPLQTALLHMQLMYYVMDTPYTLYKRDVEQIVHHTIGFGLALPTVRLGKCGLPMCAVMFSEQARGCAGRRTRCCYSVARRAGGVVRARLLLGGNIARRRPRAPRADACRRAAALLRLVRAGQQHLGAVHEAGALLPAPVQRAGARARRAQLLPELLPHGLLPQHAAAAPPGARGEPGAAPAPCAANAPPATRLLLCCHPRQRRNATPLASCSAALLPRG